MGDGRNSKQPLTEQSPSTGFTQCSEGIDEMAMRIPEHRMLCAILERCVLDILHPAKMRLTTAVERMEARRLRDEALAWISEPDDEPYTFIWICDHLTLDHNSIRNEMRRMARENVILSIRPGGDNASPGYYSKRRAA